MKKRLKSLLVKLLELSLSLYEQLSSIVWLIFLFPVYFLVLKKQGYRKITIFQYRGWHLTCRYLIAYKGEQKYFVKCGRYFLIKNEVIAINAITKVEASCVTKLQDQMLNKFFPLNYVIIEFLDAYTPINRLTSLTHSEYRQIVNAMDCILATLNCASITHRDFSPSNLFINNEDYSDVKLIDFAMADGQGLIALNFIVLNKLVYHSLGCKYRPAKYQWNDKFSVSKILEELAKLKTKEPTIND
jgi:serine/threonine protein kinase